MSVCISITFSETTISVFVKHYALGLTPLKSPISSETDFKWDYNGVIWLITMSSTNLN